MQIKLSYEALKRLVGDDTEASIALSNQIVHEFSKRHLKAVAETTTFNVFSEEVEKAVNKALAIALNDVSANREFESFRHNLEYRVSKLVENTLHDTINKVIEREATQRFKNYEDYINRMIDAKFRDKAYKAIESGHRQASIEADINSLSFSIIV